MISLRVGPLVRATDATSAIIWAELSQVCTVTLSVTPYHATHAETVTVTTPTVTVGGRHYAAPQIHGLQPATWYTYHLFIAAHYPASAAVDIENFSEIEVASLPIQSFRTATASVQHAPLRLAYGSCRKLNKPQDDVLGTFSSWLLHSFDQREELWPHILLLIGDQIYADEPTKVMLQRHPQLHRGATTFEDFALLYEYAWTHDPGIRQVLAVLPTYMIFDDHEILNNWNISPTWRARAILDGYEQMLTDGLVAYWVYQGWGNLAQRAESTHPLLRIIHDATESGEDALEALRACIQLDVYGKSDLHWHYEIPTTPPLFVVNARTDRTAVFTSNPEVVYAPTRIMSEKQMSELRTWMRTTDTSLSLLVSSVPVVLPPVIGCAEYLMGIRLWQHSAAPLRWLGLQLARIQQRLAIHMSFDHWPVFSATWRELMQSLDERQEDIVVLSGDVHFSYAIEARRAFSKARLYQLVCTPFQNALSPGDQRKILAQARIGRLTYSGLHTRMLPMRRADNDERTQGDLLMDNSLALVTLEFRENGTYDVRHEYFGVVDGHVKRIAYTELR